MPRSKSSAAAPGRRKASPSPSPSPPAHALEPRPPSLREKTNALYRAALECCRQHERYARVVTSEVEDGEERAVSREVGLCDEHVRAALDGYERAAATTNGAWPQDEWHRAANALSLASRDWIRRRTECEAATRRLARHTPEKLAQLAVEYDLEASALLALQHALAAYRKIAPEAELSPNGTPRGAD